MMTERDFEERQFSFAQVFYKDPHAVRHFIVRTPWKREALERARVFAERNWGPPDRVIVYPRTYVRDARKLVAQGLCD